MSGQGAMIGAAVGATYNAARGKDPVKGAMIGAALGGTGGAMGIPGLTGATAAGTTAATTAGTGSALTGAGASTSLNTAFMNAAGVNAGANATMGAGQAAGYTSAAVPATIFSTPTAVNATQPLSSSAGQTAALERPLSLTTSGVEPGQGYEYTMGDRLAQAGQFAQQNPALTQMAMQTGQGLLQQREPQLQSPGLLRGSPSQVATPQYQVGIPKVSLI
jgi:hypothetical protein